MTRSRPLTLLAGPAAVALIALGIAACGGGENGATAATAPPTASARPATVATANAGDLGTILVDSKGRTLYLFEKDAGTKSACDGACASAWPPLRADGTATVGGGANASLAGTATRSDGGRQVTYNGHPLYLYAGDQKAGDTNGHDLTAFGAGWYALTAGGDQVSAEASSLSEESALDDGDGY